MTRKLKKGGYTAILSLIVIAAVIVLNMIVSQLPENIKQWDISSGKIYTTGETTGSVLAGLDKDVTIYVVADPTHVDSRITKFVNRYGDLSGHVKVENVDPILHPAKVKELGAETDTLFVSCEATGKTVTIPFTDIIKMDQMAQYYYGQSKETEFDGEGQLTSAISNVTNEVQKVIYQTEGHGETGVTGPAKDLLDKSNLTLESLNLLTDGGIPEDCSLLLINAPQSDLADDEKTMIDGYLEKGGSVMILAGYVEKELPNLQGLMNQYGIQLEDGYAADTKDFYQNNPYFIFPTYDYSHEIMNGIDSSGAALVTNSGALTTLDSVKEGITVSPFMTTSDGGLLVSGDSQLPGTYVLGATASEDLGDDKTARLTVFSTPSLIDEGLNRTFSNLSNLEIFMNAVTWNFDDVENVSIPAKSLDIPYNTIPMGGLYALLFIVVIPVAVLAAGFVIWMKRRRL